jgi:hypothetical protein
MWIRKTRQIGRGIGPVFLFLRGCGFGALWGRTKHVRIWHGGRGELTKDAKITKLRNRILSYRKTKGYI